MWCIWREGNRQTFEDLDSLGDQLLVSFSGSLFDWSRAWELTSSDSLPLFLCSLLFFVLSSFFLVIFDCFVLLLHKVAFSIYIFLIS